MKTTKINSFLALVAVVMFSLQTKAQAYGLSFGDTPVSITNCFDLTTIPGVSGEQAVYNPYSKVLTLKNVTIEEQALPLVNSGCNGLKVQLEGVNTLKADELGLQLGKNTTFTGNGTLEVRSEVRGIFIDGDTRVIVKGCRMKIFGKWGQGIYGSSNGEGKYLVVDDAYLHVQGGQEAINGLSGLYLNNGVEILSPEGAMWNSEKGAVCDVDGNIIGGGVYFGRKFHFYLNDEEVTDKNADDLTVIEGVSGDEVSFDAVTNTLKLKNAAIESSEGFYCLHNYKRVGLTVQLEGINTIDAGHDNFSVEAINVKRNTTFTGNGTLNVTSTSRGLYIGECTVTVKDCRMNFEKLRSNSVINGVNVDKSYLVVDGGWLSAKGNSQNDGTITHLAGLTLKNGVEILSPTGAVWNDEKHAVCSAGGSIITEKVTIGKSYGFSINGVEVTSENAADLTVIPGVSGDVVSYDPVNNDLTLINAKLESDKTNVLWNKSCSDLMVVLSGTNTMNLDLFESTYTTMNIWANTTFTGDGTLNVSCVDNGAMFITYTATASFTGGCKVNCVSNGSGSAPCIYSDNNQGFVLVDDATLTAVGYGRSIAELTGLTMNNGVEIISPAGAVWNSSKHAVCDASGNVITKKVVIGVANYGITVCGIDVTPDNKDDVLANYSGPFTLKGKVSYNSTTKELTLDNVELDYNGYSTIQSKNSNTTIKLVGTNKINNSTWYALNMGSGTITSSDGSGTLICSGQRAGMLVDGVNTKVAVKKCEMTIEGYNYGVEGTGGSIEFEAAKVTMKCKNPSASSAKGSVYKVSLVMDEYGVCSIHSPKNAQYDSTLGGYIVRGESALTKEPVVVDWEYDDYGLVVCGTRVTSSNYNEITGPWLKNGFISYEPSTGVLNLIDVVTEYSGDYDIYADCDDMHGRGLIIKLYGNNILNSTSDAYQRGLSFYGGWIHPSTIMSDSGGKLTVSKFYSEAVMPMTIKDCSVRVLDNVWSDTYQNLSIDNARFIVGKKGHVNNSLFSAEALTLKNCYIAVPTDGYHEGTQIYDADGNVANECIAILPTGGYVNDYYFSLCGTSVTELYDLSDLTVIEGVSGDEVSYDPLLNTLTLKNATLETDKSHVLWNQACYDLIVDLQGVNTMNSTNVLSTLVTPTIVVWTNTTFIGDGTLNATCANDCAIFICHNCTLTMTDGCKVNCVTTGGYYPCINSKYDEGYLEVGNATLTAKGYSTYGSIADLTGLTLMEGAKILLPAGAVWNDEKHAVCDADGNIINEKVVIGANSPYDLNGDDKVSTADIQVIINEMKKPQASQNMSYDLNGDGKISTADIQVIINEMKK